MIVTHTYQGRSNPGSYSVQFAEVEVDVLTGITRVTDFLSVVDIGRAINRGMVEGQCRGAVQAGIGSALCEEVVLDRAGGRPRAAFEATTWSMRSTCPTCACCWSNTPATTARSVPRAWARSPPCPRRRRSSTPSIGRSAQRSRRCH